MAQRSKFTVMISANYDATTDTLTFSFTDTPRPAVAEEAADEVWVRYNSSTHKIVTVEVLNFSKRAQAVFGPELTYS